MFGDYDFEITYVSKCIAPELISKLATQRSAAEHAELAQHTVPVTEVWTSNIGCGRGVSCMFMERNLFTESIACDPLAMFFVISINMLTPP